MKKQTTQIIEKDEMRFLQDYLTPEEVFLLGFLKSFDRRIVKKWEEDGLWSLYYET